MGLFGPAYPTLRQAIVNLKTGKSFRGVIWDRRGGFFVLRNAELLKGRGETVPVDGEVLVREADVEFVQLPGGAEVD